MQYICKGICSDSITDLQPIGKMTFRCLKNFETFHGGRFFDAKSGKNTDVAKVRRENPENSKTPTFRVCF